MEARFALVVNLEQALHPNSQAQQDAPQDRVEAHAGNKIEHDYDNDTSNIEVVFHCHRVAGLAVFIVSVVFGGGMTAGMRDNGEEWWNNWVDYGGKH